MMTSSLKQRSLVVGAVILFGILLLLPTFFRDELGKSWPFSKPLSLGLDLSGGVHVVYEVQTKEAVKSNLQATANSIRNNLRKEKIAVWRSKATEGQSLDVVLVSDAHTQKAQDYIEENFKQLSLKEKSSEDGKPKLSYSIPEDQAKRIEHESVERAVETLRNRVDQFGVAEPLIQRVGENRVQLQMPGFSDVEKVKKVVGSVAKLEFRLVPVGESEGAIGLKDRKGNPVKVEDQVLMTGDAVDTARVEVSTGQVEVSLALTSDGARTFGQITSENIGRELAIILDGTVYSAPRINDAIRGGHASITGGFTVEEADQLSRILRAGALPAPLKVAEERTVGPSLGKESIKSGISAIAGGFIAILIFMIGYYKKSGIVAVVSLFLNLVLILALLSFFGATLTLPGLAGLALSIGMAVDSNVIIFERIRDELRNGATRDAAVAGGFDKAYSAILDTNVTVFVSGIILYILGTGIIRGFAVVLSIGVITTMFCAVFAARVAFDYFALTRRGNSRTLSI